MDVRVGLWRKLSTNDWCFWSVVLEKTPESPLDCREIQPVHSEGDQPWDCLGRSDANAETPVLWPSHAKSWLIGKDTNAGRDWGQEEKGTTEDEMTGWHHRLNGRESEWTPGVGDGQGGLACCDSWGRKESDTTEWLIWSDLIWTSSPVAQMQLDGSAPTWSGTCVKWVEFKLLLRVGSDFPNSSNVQAIFLNYPWSEGLLLAYLFLNTTGQEK